jgi:hypothetical protein
MPLVPNNGRQGIGLTHAESEVMTGLSFSGTNHERGGVGETRPGRRGGRGRGRAGRGGREEAPDGGSGVPLGVGTDQTSNSTCSGYSETDQLVRGMTPLGRALPPSVNQMHASSVGPPMPSCRLLVAASSSHSAHARTSPSEAWPSHSRSLQNHPSSSLMHRQPQHIHQPPNHHHSSHHHHHPDPVPKVLSNSHAGKQKMNLINPNLINSNADKRPPNLTHGTAVGRPPIRFLA